MKLNETEYNEQGVSIENDKKTSKTKTKENEYVVISDIARERERNRPLAIIVNEYQKGDKVKVVEVQGDWTKTEDGYILSNQIEKQ